MARRRRAPLAQARRRCHRHGRMRRGLRLLANGARDIPGHLLSRKTATIRVHGGPQAVPLRRSATARMAGRIHPRPSHHHHRFDRAPRPGRGGRSLARLSVQLHVLRQGELPQQVSQAPGSRRAATRSTACIAPGRRIRLFHRRDFPAQRELLNGLIGRGLKFGVQTRIDLWSQTCSRCSAKPAASPPNAASRV